MATDNYSLFPKARNSKNIVNQINIRFVFVCALPSIGYGIFIWHIKKYWYHKNYCSVPKHCCLKPQLAIVQRHTTDRPE